jgi:hypothetical protein
MMTNFVDIVVLNADTAVGRPLQVTQGEEEKDLFIFNDTIENTPLVDR